MGLSAVVITYNEEARLETCLQSLSFADEIVVLDSFSTDRTLEIARQYTDNVGCREFVGFSDQWNAAIAMATQEWVMIVAADEIVSDGLAADVVSAISSGMHDAYRLPRSTYFLGRRMRYCGWYPDYQLRLVKRSIARIADRLVHETLVVDCERGTLKHDLIHHSYATMDDFCRKMVAYARAGAQQKFSEGRRFHAVDLLNPGFTFFKMYVIRQGFRDGLHGLVLSALAGCSSALRYAILWDLGLHEARGKERDDAT